MLRFLKNTFYLLRFAGQLSISVDTTGKVALRHPCGLFVYYLPAHAEDNSINELYIGYKGVLRQASAFLSLQDDGIRHWQLPESHPDSFTLSMQNDAGKINALG